MLSKKRRLPYDLVGDLTEGISVVRKDMKFGYIDSTGKEVVAPIYNGAMRFSDNKTAHYNLKTIFFSQSLNTALLIWDYRYLPNIESSC